MVTGNFRIFVYTFIFIATRRILWRKVVGGIFKNTNAQGLIHKPNNVAIVGLALTKKNIAIDTIKTGIISDLAQLWFIS
jgi:hypothetical protein